MDEGKKTKTQLKNPQKIQRRNIVLLVFISSLAVLIYLKYFQIKTVDLSLWTETTVPYDTNCTKNCKVAGSLGSNHGSPEIELIYNPNVNDSVAQWGDCLQSIFVCISERNQQNISQIEKADLARVCVEKSVCPAPCKELYSRKSAKSAKAAKEVFDDIFINEDAWCRPQERTK